MSDDDSGVVVSGEVDSLSNSDDKKGAGSLSSSASLRSLDIPHKEFGETRDPSEDPKSDKKTDILSIVEELKGNIMRCVDDQLKRFVDLDGSAGVGGEAGNDLDSVDDAGLQETALRLVLHNLRKIKLDPFADQLSKNERMVAYRQQLKQNLIKRFTFMLEGNMSQEPLNKTFTELYLVKGDKGEMNTEHEVRQIEKVPRNERNETLIKCSDIFKPIPGEDVLVTTVLTKGVAGIGKTVSVQKFVLDWAEGKANQDLQFVFPIPFRHLNLLKGKKCNLIEVINTFFPGMKHFGSFELNVCKTLFIFDGLDECHFPLDFQNSVNWNSSTEPTMVDVLVTNLIRGHLLPSALIWITSRPGAANRIPPNCVHLVTEVRGFNDPQKEEYFRKRFGDKDVAEKVIAHVKSIRSIYIMCHIPVFCWISANVLEKEFSHGGSGENTRTLTQLYTQFLIFHKTTTNCRFYTSQEYEPCKATLTHEKFLLNLAKLAYTNLKTGNLIFYENQLKECNIDTNDASLFSGVFTGILKEEAGLYQKNVYCFVHLSIQEYFAALHTAHIMSKETLPFHSLKQAVDKALRNATGHWDLYLRFLLGLSMETNLTLLQDFVTLKSTKLHRGEEIIPYIKDKITSNLSPERTINLFHCLNELNDHSLVEDIKDYLGKGELSGVRLKPAQLSALAFILLTSEEQLDEFDLKKYAMSDESLQRLMPAVRVSKTALLDKCNLSAGCCAELASVLSANSSQLQKLDISYNNIGNLGVGLLSDGLGSPQCQLEILRLCACEVLPDGCASLSSALQLNALHLRELDLSFNPIHDSGVKLLAGGIETSKGKLEMLRLIDCEITVEGCASLDSALRAKLPHLRVLDLSCNNISNSGIKFVANVLSDPCCQLSTIQLAQCGVTDHGFDDFFAALHSNHSHLRELDLGYNQANMMLLCATLILPSCQLEKIRLSGCQIQERGFSSLASALNTNPKHLRELDLSNNYPGEEGITLLAKLLSTAKCRLETLKLTRCNLNSKSCEVLAAAFSSDSSELKELDLSDNDLQDSGVKSLSVQLRQPHCKLRTLRLSGCQVTADSCTFLASALHPNGCRLTELDLAYNDPGETGIAMLLPGLEDIKCILNVGNCDNSRMKSSIKKYACQLTLDADTAHRNLLLSDGNRKVTWQQQELSYPDHPERFDCFLQVLCREGLAGRCYWEVDWDGEKAHIAVAYNRIGRKGRGYDSCFGENFSSWTLECCKGYYRAIHNKNCTHITRKSHFSNRVGVYVDWKAGNLSFYSVSSGELILLHIFYCKFTEPLFAGFLIQDKSSACLLANSGSFSSKL